MVDFKVRFPSGNPELTISVQEHANFAEVKSKIKQAHGLPETAYVRVLCAGREMGPLDPVSRATSSVLHVITALEPPPPRSHSPERRVSPLQAMQQPLPATPPLPPAQPPPADWLDLIDPGTLLMWIFGLIICVLWLLLLFNSRMFDSTSVIVLFIMTIAFLLPVALSYLPFPTFLTPHIQPWQLRGVAPNPTQQHQAARQSPGGQYSIVDGEYIPPRPAARVRPHQA